MDGADMLALRQTMGLSWAKLAAELGVHWNTINRWERGDRRIPEPVARLLRKIVEESMNTLNMAPRGGSRRAADV